MIIALVTSALAGSCSTTTISELAAMEAPSVFVLGERKGTQPDLGRAHRLALRLHEQNSLTIALQAIPVTQQPLLDRYAKGEIAAVDLPGLLDWNTAWGFPWAPYARLVTAADREDRVVGIGVPFGTQPEGAIVPRPPGYMAVLTDAMTGHYMPAQLEPQFVQNVAWSDHRMAAAAVENWNGKGHLMVIADRTHVEGGKGIPWQLSRMVEAPVHTVLLGGPGGCYDGDLVLGR